MTVSKTYCNGELEPSTHYAVFQRSFDGYGSYDSEKFIRFTTKKFIKKFPEKFTKKSFPLLTVFVVVVVVLIVLVLAGVVVYIYSK